MNVRSRSAKFRVFCTELSAFLRVKGIDLSSFESQKRPFLHSIYAKLALYSAALAAFRAPRARAHLAEKPSRLAAKG
jgi:hypothetical protein